MILEGKVIKCIEVKEGVSKTSGKEWTLASYLIDTTTNEQYSRQVVVEVFGEDRIKELSLIPDEQVKLNVEAESREFNGKWYTSVRAWGRAEDNTDAQPETQVVQTAQPETQVVPEDDSTQLPF
jgi:hypothetical protein